MGELRSAPELNPSMWCQGRSMGDQRVCELPLLDQVINCRTDTLHNVFKRVVVRGPCGNRFTSYGKHLEFGEAGIFPIGGTQDDRDHTGLVEVMPSNRFRHFDTIA